MLDEALQRAPPAPDHMIQRRGEGRLTRLQLRRAQWRRMQVRELPRTLGGATCHDASSRSHSAGWILPTQTPRWRYATAASAVCAPMPLQCRCESCPGSFRYTIVRWNLRQCPGIQFTLPALVVQHDEQRINAATGCTAESAIAEPPSGSVKRSESVRRVAPVQLRRRRTSTRPPCPTFSHENVPVTGFARLTTEVTVVRRDCE